MAASTPRVPPGGVNLAELPIREPPEQQVGLGVGIGGIARSLAVDAAVRLVQVQSAIVVEVVHPQAETREPAARHAQADRDGVVAKEGALVPVDRIGLAAQVDDDQVQVRVVVEIDGIDPHAGLRLAVEVHADAGHQRVVLEPPTAAVQPELVRHLVVRNEEVECPRPVEVAKDETEPVPEGGAEAGGLRDVRERAVSVIPEQDVAQRMLCQRAAVVRSASLARARQLRLHRPVEVVRREQIQVAVGIVVNERGARAPAGVADAG